MKCKIRVFAGYLLRDIKRSLPLCAGVLIVAASEILLIELIKSNLRLIKMAIVVFSYGLVAAILIGGVVVLVKYIRDTYRKTKRDCFDK